jgi:enoyl-CoA hydratase/carnithine racemase
MEAQMVTFDTYREAFPNARLSRKPNGVLEVALHTDGGKLVFNGHTHEQFVHLFHVIGEDHANRVVILTGRGDAFIEAISPEGFEFILATPQTVVQDKPHFEFGIVPGDGVALFGAEVIGSILGRYVILTRQLLDAPTAKDYGVVNEIVRADRLLAGAHEIGDGIGALPPLTSRYTRIALTQKLRRIIDEGLGYRLALEGISAADVARAAAQSKRARAA